MIGTLHAEPLFIDRAVGITSPSIFIGQQMLFGGGFIMPGRAAR